MTSSGSSASRPTREGSPALPSIVPFRDGGGERWFLVTDPDGPYRIVDSGGVRTDRDDGALGALALLGALAGGVWAAVQASGWLFAVVLFLLGAVGGFLGGCVASLPVVAVGRARQRADDRRVGRTPSLRVAATDRRAWDLCRVATDISRVGAWTDRTVDPDRRVPAIVWAAVRRALVVDQQYADARRALAHENLRELAEDTIARAEREYESLELVQQNLRQVLETARGIDRRRVELTREQEIARERMLEERELRARLTGSYGAATDAGVSDAQADSAAGLATQAEVVADLLADSDRMLRDLT